MPDNEKKSHTLKAWIEVKKSSTTLRIEGEIPTNGEKPNVGLKEAVPQGTNPGELLLNFQPDVYDPEGGETLTIGNFSRPVKNESTYKTVLIVAKKGNISLPIEIKESDE